MTAQILQARLEIKVRLVTAHILLAWVELKNIHLTQNNLSLNVKHAEYVVRSLFSSVSVLYAVLKNSNCNRSSYFTLKWSSFTTAALYLLCLYLRYTQSHLTGCIYFFKFRRQIFFWLCPGVKSISWVLFQGSLFLPHRNTSPLLQALGFLALLIRNAQPSQQSPIYVDFQFCALVFPRRSGQMKWV